MTTLDDWKRHFANSAVRNLTRRGRVVLLHSGSGFTASSPAQVKVVSPIKHGVEIAEAQIRANTKRQSPTVVVGSYTSKKRKSSKSKASTGKKRSKRTKPWSRKTRKAKKSNKPQKKKSKK